MRDKSRLHLGGAHAMTRDIDDIVDPTRDPVITVRVTPAAVAREVLARIGFEVGVDESVMIAEDCASHAYHQRTQRDEAELIYKQTVLQAFGDVSNSLVGYSQSRLYRMKIEEQTKTYKDMADLATVRFKGGVTSFLEVQYYEQQYFTSALSLEQAWYTELQNYVQLYQALGGGWEQQ